MITPYAGRGRILPLTAAPLLACWLLSSASAHAQVTDTPPVAQPPASETPSVLDDSAPSASDLSEPSIESFDEDEFETGAEEEKENAAAVATASTVESQATQGNATEPPESEGEQEKVANRSESRRRKPHPRYQYQRPAWGGMLAYTPEAFGGLSPFEGFTTEKVRGVRFSYDWQPKFIQAFGIIGIGPHLSAYPLYPESALVEAPTSIWGYGGRVHYQARYFREQPIVPFVSYSYEQMKFELASGSSGSATLQGVSYGAMFLLNWLEPSTAAESYASLGVLRTYFVAELSQSSGTLSTGGSIGGQTLSFALRMEH